jgi:hypothetical protein
MQSGAAAFICRERARPFLASSAVHEHEDEERTDRGDGASV